MSNCYTNTCFEFTVTAQEAALLRQSIAFCNAVSDEDDETISRLWDEQTDAFRALYPATGDEPASGFLALFDDPQFPYLDVTLTYNDQDDGGVIVRGESTEFSPENVAAVLARCITTSLPIGITWADDCDKFMPGNFGGGGFHINRSGIHWVTTYDIACAKLFEPQFVLALADPSTGLAFWNEHDSFGDLACATVFSESEKDATAIPSGFEAANWLQLPSK